MFNNILSDHDWNPINGCPGRYILARGVIDQSLSEFLNLKRGVISGASESVPDPFEYVKIDGGGLISYRKDNGWLHTLGDEIGFANKLRSLGLHR